MSKYDPLRHFLEARVSSETPMTFAEIEKVLGFHLPDSARKFPAWWSNNTGTHVGVSAWRDAGFRTARVDIGSEQVTFVREAGGARAARAVRETAAPFAHGTGSFTDKAIVVPFDDLSRSALRMIDDWAEEAGLDRSAAAAAILEASAAGRRRQLLEALSVAVMPAGHDSTAMIRQDRDDR
jgi:hypothetical protein